jgi:DNA-binding transcriptional LysR family regulator
MNFLLTKKLKYFMMVMEKRCLNKACEELFITRSPLGKTINELEILFGEKLFIRQHGLFEPTKYALDIYTQTEPLYRKIMLIEDQLDTTKKHNVAQIILDSTFPDNPADILESSLKKSRLPYQLCRRKITQEDIDAGELSHNTLIVSNNLFPVPQTAVVQSHSSSALLLITNCELKDQPEKLAEIPLLVRENMVTSAQMHLPGVFEKAVHFTPKIRGVNGSILDFLLMSANGTGYMLLPITTCEMLNINRSHTILLDNIRVTTYFYYRRNTKNNEVLTNIIKYISKLF